ncbi:hypothetical protein H2203_008369 [Taxawa tesnikishii (nom. ined.)]|nr:hypothetical protein H2203_008369 [Dothideales sp. JES 119]
MEDPGYWANPDLQKYFSGHGRMDLVDLLFEKSNASSTSRSRPNEVGRPTRFSEDELEGFLRARNIDSTHCQRKFHLVKCLENADKNYTFPRFIELPIELREAVYTHYFKNGPELAFPLLPALARVCKQLRDEVLPVFCRTQRFIINLGRVARVTTSTRAGKMQAGSRKQDTVTAAVSKRETQLPPLFANLPVITYCNITKLQVQGVRFMRRTQSYDINITLDGTATGYRTTFNNSKRVNDHGLITPLDQRQRDQAINEKEIRLTRLNEYLGAVVGRTGNKKLRIENLQAIVALLGRSLLPNEVLDIVH